MKYSKIYLLTFISLLVGSLAGYWFAKSANQTISQSENPHIHTSSNPQIPESTNPQIYTCSMHPQIRQEEPGDCPLCGMDLIPLTKNSSDDPLVLQMTNAAVQLANIQTTIVGEEAGGSQKTIRLSGKVQADERLASSLVAHVPGRIEKLYVTFTGEQVKKGQKLATLYAPELITAQRELLEALKLQELSPGLLEAARNKLRYWKIGKSTIEAIEKSGSIQETFTLYAEESGIVTNRRVAVGDYVKQGEPLFDLMNLRKVWVLFDAYEEDLATISVGAKMEFTTASIPNKIFKTRVTFIDPIINPNTRVASIRTEVNNAGGLLKPEMFVSGMLQKKGTSKSQLTIPKSAVLWTGIRSVVYVKVPDTNIPSFQFREIEIGEALGMNYQVISGLEAGEEVVTYGSFTIDAAAQLNNQASMMNKKVKLKGEGDSKRLPDYTVSTPVEFKTQLGGVSEAYLLLKDALVESDPVKAGEATREIEKTLAKVDMALLKGDAHIYWMSQFNALEAHGKKITKLNDIEEQRKQFGFFSEALIKAVKVFGIPKDTLYVEHCPMAFGNEGADWLSREKEIRNPYFGDKMLTCGIVKDTIDRNFKNPPMKQAANARPNLHKH